MKLITALLALLILPSLCHSQNFRVPDNIKLDKAEDYAKYEKDILDCISWLEETPVDVQVERRQQANTFLMMWVTGSPTVTITLGEDALIVAEKNPELLMTFIGGWTKLVIENPQYKSDDVKGNLAGLQSVIKVYKKGKGIIKRDKDIDRLIKLDDAGTLEAWVKEHPAAK